MKTYLIDLDGTMYRGNSNIPGAIEFIDYCLSNQIPFCFLTNNATRTKKENVEHMLKLGFHGIEEHHFFTSAMACAKYLSKLNQGNKAYYIGQAGLEEALVNEGFVIDDENPDFVVVGLDKQGTYEKYSKALQLCIRGAKLVGTNDDRLLAHGDTFMVGNGSVVAMFEYATGQKSPKIGKPHSPILLEALDYFNLKKDEVVLIGDNLETDILLGVNNQVETILVLGGVHDRNDIERLGIYPDRIIDSCFELIK